MSQPGVCLRVFISGVIELVFDKVEHGHQGPTALQRVAWHGVAATEQHNLAEAIAELREMADGRNDISLRQPVSPQELGMLRLPPMSALNCLSPEC
jgi:hypothetical protein